MMNLKKYIGLAVLPMVFSACQEDTLVNDQAQGIYTLKATVDNAAPMSRAQVVLGGTSTTTETFHWNAGDSLKVFEYDNAMPDISEHLFKISGNYDGNSASAEFTTTNALTVGKKFTAIYPAPSLNDDGTVNLQMEGLATLNDDSESSWVNYFSNNMYMLATGTVAEGMNLQMEHLCSLLRVTYTNATDEDKEIYSVAAYGHLFGYRTFGVANLNESANDDARYDRIGVKFDNGLTVAAGESKDFYILVFSYFDEKNYTWDGMNGFIIAQPNNVYLSTPETYNGQEFKLQDLNPGSSYWFNITQTADGLVWTKDVNQGEEEDVTVTFSNKEFSKALYDYLGADKVTLNADSCAVMTEENVLAVTGLIFEDQKYTITSLSGIENFVNLQYLECSYMGLEECDLSKNTNLRNARIQGNNLTSLDFSNCPELQTLICSYMMGLTSLNLTGCTKLSNLQSQDTGLTTLNIPNPEAMDNFLTPAGVDIDLTPYINLTGLGLIGRNLENLDIIPKDVKAKLTFLTIDNNNLTKLDLTEFTNLRSLNCSFNQMAELDITPLENLNDLWCVQRGNINLLLTLTQAQLDRLVQEDANWANGQNLTMNIVSSGNAGGGTSEAE